MTETIMYLTKNSHGVYYYRRPIVAEDQAFWVGPSGSPKKEWSKSLRTKDRRTAIDLLTDAAALYEAERTVHFGRKAAEPTANLEHMTLREQEEHEATTALEASRRQSYTARKQVRTLLRQRMQLSTAELDPKEAAARDLVREKGQDTEELKATVAMLQARVAELGGAERSRTRNYGSNASQPDHTLEKLLEAYQSDKAAGWSKSSERAVVPVFRLLRELFNGRSVESITRDDARDVRAVLQSLPKQIGKRRELRGLSVRKAIEVGERLNLPIIQPKTINDGYLVHIAAIFNWAVKEQWIASSPFIGLSVNDPLDDAERRDPFAANDLQTLFRSAPWQSPRQAGDAKCGAYWVPLLCLFHGLRLGEAAGLRVVDMSEIDGLPVLHIHEYEGRTLKTKGSRGTLPLHPVMKALGFDAYIAERRGAGEVLLFPEGTANGRGQTAAKLGERFSRDIKRHGFAGRKLGMHSFRHNFEDQLREAELPERTASALSRRTESGSSSAYGIGLSASQMATAIAKVTYPSLDLTHLYRSDG